MPGKLYNRNEKGKHRKMNDQNCQMLVEQFYYVAGRMSKLRTAPICLEGAEPLNLPAIHMIDMIEKHPDYKLTQIAEILDVTKGAISQMAQKLEQKGLIRKVEHPENEKNIYFQLTEAGRQVYDGHEKLHREMYSKLKKMLAPFNDQDAECVKQVLQILNDCLIVYGHL